MLLSASVPSPASTVSQSRICAAQKSFCNYLSVGQTWQAQSRPNQTDHETNRNIDEYIQSIPAKSSRYSRNDNHNKKYLSEDLSVAKMHRRYLKPFERDVTAELCLGGDSKPAVKYEYYLNRFNTLHSLSFGRARSDTCPTCDMIELTLKEDSDASTKARLEVEKLLHLRKAQHFHTLPLAFDFEQNLPVPVLPVGELFYARQLWLRGGWNCVTSTHVIRYYDIHFLHINVKLEKF